jgi:predicted nucleic acid-binding protein
MGAIDCLILASAKINNLKVLTGDPHFDGVEGVIR